MGGRASSSLLVAAALLTGLGCARVGDRQHDAGHPTDAVVFDAGLDVSARDGGVDASARDASTMDAPLDGGHDASTDAGHDAAAIDAALGADSGALTATWSASARGLPCTVGTGTTFHSPSPAPLRACGARASTRATRRCARPPFTQATSRSRRAVT